MRLPFMPNDPRVVDSTGALALKEVPKRMLILTHRHRYFGVLAPNSPLRSAVTAMAVMRRRVRVSRLSQIGMMQHNQHRNSRSISASTGDWLRRRF